MIGQGRGYWQLEMGDVAPDSRYFLRLDGELERPDPASRWQPQGVHGPSAVVDHAAFPWTDGDWAGVSQDNLVIYELHVGTFAPRGTFAAVIPRLQELRQLGITAIELMPVAQFPGGRNWGYDGVCPFAVQDSYGGPDGLKALVDACHREGLAVLLDVVYNHLGPEGNYLRDFGPYFTDRYRTPWGEAVNFDGPGSDEVRRYFIDNALCWLRDYHLDGLRLDALHAVFDQSAYPFLRQLADEVRAFGEQDGRPRLLIAESDLNDVRLVQPSRLGGYGLDGQWNDDFHHTLHVLLTGERRGYYADFHGVNDLAKAFSVGFVYDGRYSDYRRRRHGSSAADLAGRQLVVFAQNHDQVGNRLAGERLVALAGFEAAKVAAAAVLLAANVPLLFMGEEYGETVPFLFFVSFDDPELAEAVRRGRREEFAAFDWPGTPPDPQAEETFLNSRLDWDRRRKGRHGRLFEWHRRLLALRREHPALRDKDHRDLAVEALERNHLLVMTRCAGEAQLVALFAFGRAPAALDWPLPGRWAKLLDSTAPQWDGPGSTLPATAGEGDPLRVPPQSVAIFERKS